MKEISIIFAIVLGILIIVYEIFRTKKSIPIDILSGVNFIYVLSFVIPPISIYFFELQIPTWASRLKLDGSATLIVSLYSLIGYASLILGYQFSKKIKNLQNLKIEFISEDIKIRNLAHIIGLLGLLFFVLFIYSIGGINNFFVLNTQLRSGTIDDLPYAFIRNLALFIPISAQIFYALYKFKEKSIYNRNFLFFIFYFIISVLIYFNRATRMGLLLFLISFILINALYYRSSLKKYIPVIGTLFLIFVFYGKRFYNFFIIDEFTFNDVDIDLDALINQFSFPFYTLTGAIENSFFNDVPRFFVDFILGILNLIPAFIVPFDIPQTLTQLNTAFFMNGVPIDIISLGYYSFGISGIIIITFLLGVQISLVEKILEDKTNVLVVVLYSQFIFLITLLIPYASPSNAMKSNFCLIIVCILSLSIFKNKNRTNLKEQKK